VVEGEDGKVWERGKEDKGEVGNTYITEPFQRPTSRAVDA